jgi:hypothetical protein
MHTDETPPPDPKGIPRPQEEEIGAALLRLLRLVAAEVAESLRKQNNSESTAPNNTDETGRNSSL